MMMDVRPRLECEMLHKAFNGVQAVSGVSLDVSGPGVVGLIGPNGAGKTTLLDLVTGFRVPDGGCWSIGGVDVTGSTPEGIVERGMVRSFQHPRMVPGLSVLENMLLAAPLPRNQSFLGALWRRSADRALEKRELSEAKRLLEWAGLSTHVDALASTLSYGVRIRLFPYNRLM